MKILVLNKYCPDHPLAGGAEKRLKEEFSRISKMGHEVHLICAKFPDCKKEEKKYGINIHRIGFDGRYNIVWVHIFGFFLQIYFVRKIKPDIVYEDISPIPWFTPLLIWNVPVISIWHHINGKLFFETQPFFKALIAYILESAAFITHRNSPLISVSPSTTKILKSRGMKNIIEILSGVDYNFFKPSKKNKHPTVVYVGRLEKRKGVDLFIKTYDLLKKKIPDVEYIIVGSGPDEEEFKKLAGNKRINFTGFISEYKKRSYLQSAWVSVLPSRMEGFGLTILESNACGTPIIGNNIKGIKDAIVNGKNGLLTDCHDTKKFVNDIIYLLQNKKMLKSMSKEARRIAEKYDWEQTAIGTLNAFKKVM